VFYPAHCLNRLRNGFFLECIDHRSEWTLQINDAKQCLVYLLDKYPGVWMDTITIYPDPIPTAECTLSAPRTAIAETDKPELHRSIKALQARVAKLDVQQAWADMKAAADAAAAV
jgi:hypothetical protein